MAAISIEPRAALAIPWGPEGSLDPALPADWPEPEVFEPELGGALHDYPAALAAALDAPLGGRRLTDGIGAGARVAIVVDDPSRWTPVREALPIVLGRLHAAGVRREDVSISVGVGRHHAVDRDGLRRRLGAEVVASYRCESPPVDDLAQYVELGITPEGVPVRVFRPVAAADIRVLIGSVLPHLQAGFGGGYKLIFPGTSHRSTLGALHRQGLGGDPGRLLGGPPAGNPMRRAIRSAAALLRGPCVSISHLMGPPGTVFRVASGCPDAVQEALAAEVRRRFGFPGPDPAPADVVVAGNAPWPGDPLQSFKVLLNHRAAGRRGGVLVGFFWTDPAEIDRSFPLRSLRVIAATGALGGWAARRLLPVVERLISATGTPGAFLLRWARELVVDRTVLVYAPPLFERVGPRLGPVLLFNDRDALWRAANTALGNRPPARIRAFPWGGLTYCPRGH